MTQFRIRESHLKHGAFGLVADGKPVIDCYGRLMRFETMREASREVARIETIAANMGRKFSTLEARSLRDMPEVEIYGMEHVLRSSGAN